MQFPSETYPSSTTTQPLEATQKMVFVEESQKPALETIKGKVTDENSIGLPGVSIILKGTQRGTTTNTEGLFSIEVPDNKAVLVFSFVGYLSQEVVVGNQNQFNIGLKIDNKALEEVVGLIKNLVNCTWNDRQYLWPIPTEEIQINPNMKQNNGY